MNEEGLNNKIAELENENMRLKIKNRYLSKREEQLTNLLIEAHIRIVQLEGKNEQQ